jgi:tetratricopeptide (TPR) repeat protein
MKRYVIASVVWMLAAVPSFAQRFRMGEVNAETPEGKLLQQIGQESDVSKKLALLEQFAASYPTDKNVGWVYEQMQTAEVKVNQPEKAMEVGEKLLAMDPEDAEAAHQGLKAAESRKDADQIRKWAALTSQTAQKIVSSPQPKAADEVADWKNRVDWANQVKLYADYSLYAAALQTSDFNKKIELIDALQAQNPQSEYLAKTAPLLFLAYRQTGANEKAIALAEKVLATDQSDEDMLLVVADHYLQNRRNPEKVHAYAAKIVEILNAKPAPEGVADADWQKRKSTVAGVAHYLNGKLYYTENAFAPADRELRAALPLIQDNPQLKPEVLFYLGVADFKLEKAQDAANFNRECAALKSPYAATCAKNLTAIRTQYRGVK